MAASEYYGIDGTGLEWFKAYFSNRKQRISSQDVSINCISTRTLLFLIYVTGRLKASNPLIEVMFADDTNLFMFKHPVQVSR